jgi:hypothetical protein
MKKEFEDFLRQKGIELSLPQKHLSDLLFACVIEDNLLEQLLLNKQSGKTFLFRLLDEFFSSIEIGNRDNLILPNKHGHISTDSSIHGAD